MKKLVLLSVFLLASAISYAGGYRVSLQGNRALAMGHTGVALVDSAELVFFNPAGLVYLENKLTVSAGGFGVFSDVAYQDSVTGASAVTNSPVGTPAYAYIGYQATDWLSFGLGLYTPYGSSVSYEDDWAGSHLVNNIELQAIYLQGSVAFKLHEKFSVSAGFIYVNGSVNFNRNLNRTLQDLDGNRSEVTINADGVTNTGWTVSAMFNPIDKVRIGATYRSEIILEATEGTAVFENLPQSTAVPFVNTGVDASLPLPAEMSVGISYEFADKWTAAFDLNATYWSVFESLDIDFENEAIPDSFNARNYETASTYRFGLQYEATEIFTLRGGYYYDESPVQNGFFAPETPRNDANGFTAGLSFNLGDHFSIDASFLYLQFNEIDASYDFYFENGTAAPFSGTYKSSAFVPGLGLSYRL